MPRVEPGGEIDPSKDPAAIDRAVRDSLGSGQSLYEVDEAALAALKPDVILTQDVCSVCSIDLASVERVARALPGPPRVVSLNPSTIEDVLDDLLRVSAALGPEWAARGDRAMVGLRERLFRAEEYVNPYEDGPVVAFLEWTDPLFCAGHWTVELIERAGGRHPWNETVARADSGAAAGPQRGARVAGASRVVSSEELVNARPEFLVIAPCGFSLDQAWACTEELATREWWGELPAVKRGRVAVVDGNQMFNRPGPRLIDAFEWLVGWVQERPELMPHGFPWRAWGVQRSRL